MSQVTSPVGTDVEVAGESTRPGGQVCTGGWASGHAASLETCGACCSFRGSWESCLIHAADVHLHLGRGQRAGGTCLGVFHIEIISEATSVDRISGE